MRILAIAALLSLSIAALPKLSAQPPLLATPRKAPDFTLVEPSGKKTALSTYRGKVVVLAFVSTICPHCQHECELLSKLSGEMKAKGVPVQMLASAFNDNAAALVPGFIRDFKVTFPVGYTDPNTVFAFQQFSVMDRPSVPQLAVIDKNGMIRAQTPLLGDPNLQDENYLRGLIAKLAGEGISATPIKKSPTKAGSSLR